MTAEYNRDSTNGQSADDDASSFNDADMALVRQMQATYQAGRASTPVRAVEAEISAVVATIARLADGNCATRADVKLVGGHAGTRAVRLGMKVTIGWASTNRALPGSPAIKGSRAFAGFAGVQAYLEDTCHVACQDPATAKRVADQIALSPVVALDSYVDRHQLGQLPFSAHFVEQCDVCDGSGKTRCKQSTCKSGKVDCRECNRTGTGFCTACNGNDTRFIKGPAESCRQCRGTGRSGPCHACNGEGWVRCIFCHGSGQIGCIPCEKTGCITRAYSSHLTGSVSRSVSFDSDAPEGYRRSCQAIVPRSALAQTTGTLVRSEIGADAGVVRLVLHCQTRHVHAEMDCKRTQVVVDAIGPRQTIPLMPPFLDKLMSGLINDIRSKSVSHPVQALTQATTARLTRDILASVGRGGSAKTSVAGNTWQGAISESRITDVHGWLKVAYSTAARSSVRRTWLLLSPLIVAGAALANVCRFPDWVLHQMGHVTGMPGPSMRLPMGIACELIATLPVVAGAWLLAGRIGRRHIRAGVGALAQRSPRQGMWPVLGLLLATAAGWGSALLKLDTLVASQPRAPGLSDGKHVLNQPVTARATDGTGTPEQPRPSTSGAQAPSHASPQVHSRHQP